MAKVVGSHGKKYINIYNIHLVSRVLHMHKENILDLQVTKYDKAAVSFSC